MLLEAGILKGFDENKTKELLATWAAEMKIIRRRTHIVPGRCVIDGQAGGTVVIFNEGSNFEGEHFIRSASALLKTPLLYLSIYNDECWGYKLFDMLHLVDYYDPRQHRFHRQCVEDSAAIAKCFNINEDDICNYLVAQSEKTVEKRAYPDDKYCCLDARQIGDFIARLGFCYPLFMPHKERTAMPAVPDKPVPFGVKNMWLTVKSGSPEEVIDRLRLECAVPANWQSGIEEAYHDSAFVTPSLNGLVSVVGIANKELYKTELEPISALFEEVQYFCTHRVVEYHSWVKYTAGRLIRAYAFCGERGEVLWNEGSLTREENDLGFSAFPVSTGAFQSITGSGYDALRLPDEKDVLDISARWGVDTGFDNAEYPPGTGYLCKRMT